MSALIKSDSLLFEGADWEFGTIQRCQFFAQYV